MEVTIPRSHMNVTSFLRACILTSRITILLLRAKHLEGDEATVRRLNCGNDELWSYGYSFYVSCSVLLLYSSKNLSLWLSGYFLFHIFSLLTSFQFSSFYS